MDPEEIAADPYTPPEALDSPPVVLEPVPQSPGDVRPPFPWRYAWVLLVACLLASLLVLPYTAALLVQSKSPPITQAMLPFILTVSVVIDVILSFATILLGLGLGRSLGLVWPPLDGWDAEPDAERRMASSLLVAAALGVLSAGVIQGLARGLPPAEGAGQEITLPSWWASALGSVGAGIREEVWLRMGMMTFFVWLGAKLARQKTPTAPVVWTANTIAAVLFGAIHVPQAAMLLKLSASLLAFVFLGNGIPALIFGWLYWRKGLVAAMMAHAVADIVTKVIFPFLGV
jgi:hypothetical protein